MMKHLLLTSVCICLCVISFAQSNPRYLVLYKDKANSPFSVDKPTDFLSQRSVTRRTRQNVPVTTNDLPVNPAYVAAVKQTGAQIIYSSRWFNGTLVEASASQLEQIKKLSFYKGIELNLPVANLTSKTAGIERTAVVNNKLETTEDIDYGRMRDQLTLMEVEQLHQKGFHGEGMLIAVLDDGFSQANQVGFLKPLFDEKRVADTHDFVARETNVYNDGSHGLNVLSAMAAYLPVTMVAIAFKATYALYRTENNNSESPYEEITWLLGAERADSLGADVINSSLGYTTFDGEFGTPAYNHTYEQMDGKTTIVSRAARFATRKGILVSNSAGNDGNKSWKYIAAPADVDSVLTVGATLYDRSYSAFSSVGPNAVGQQKPDIAAVGTGTVVGNTAGNAVTGNGTSFSSPQIAALSAVLWQAYPNLTAQQIIYVLKKSGNQATRPDNLLGYGVPAMSKAEQIIKAEFAPLGTENNVIRSIVLSPNPAVQNLTLTIPQSLIGKKASLTIYQINGQSVSDFQVLLSEKTDVKTNALSTGLYLLKVRVGDQESALKFIKQ